jgi:4-carboxymuconolactone decarboxylase
MSDEKIWPRLARPGTEDRLARAREIRERLGIYGERGQVSKEFRAIPPVHEEGIVEWCFGMVWAETPGDLKRKEIIVLTALAAQDLPTELERHVEAALNLGLTREEIVGVFVQATPYIGLPKANHAILAAMRAFKAIDGGKAARN